MFFRFPYTSNVTTAPTHTLPGRDSITATLGAPETSNVATSSPKYSKRPSCEFRFWPPLINCVNFVVYYRIYAEDGGIPSKTPVTSSDPYLGRIKVESVPPPRTAKTVKRSIAKLENIKDRTSTTLFPTLFIESPMDDAEKVTILNASRTGPGSTPQEPRGVTQSGRSIFIPLQ